MDKKKATAPIRGVRLAVIILATAGLVACGGGGINGNDAEGIPQQALAIDVLSALVAPSYTLDIGDGNGPVAFPVSEYNDGNFILRSTTSATDQALLGSSAVPAAVQVVQDSYNVLFQQEHGDTVPQNVNSAVQTNIDITSVPNPFPIDVTAWMVTPTFTQNGVAFPVSEYDDGVFYLQPQSTDIGGERIYLGNSHTPMPSGVLVMQGTYDVIYSLETGGNQVPVNQNAVVMSNVLVDQDMALAIDVKSVRFQFDATLDGQPFLNNQYLEAKFFLRNPTAGDRADLATSYELNASPVTVLVVDGSYDIVYQHVQGVTLPSNTDALIMSNVLVSLDPGGSQAEAPDITSVLITPSFTLDSIAFQQSEYNDANFFLRSVANNNDVMFLGASNRVTPDPVRVISSTDIGNYDVLYRHEHGDEVPQNTNAVVRSNVLLSGDVSPFNVPVTSVNITGRFTLNGNNFPSDGGDSVQFLLRGANNTSDEFLFGFSDLSNEPVKLIPGSYDVVLDYIEGDDVPQNEKHTVKFNEALTADNTLRVNVLAKGINPAFTLDGATFQASFYQSAKFYLRDITNNTRIFLGNSYGNNNAVTVVNGTYDVVYEHRSGNEVPQNKDSKVGSVVVQ